MYKILTNTKLSMFARLVWAVAYTSPEVLTVRQLATTVGVHISELSDYLWELQRMVPQNVNFSAKLAPDTQIWAILAKPGNNTPENALKRSRTHFEPSNPVLTLAREFDASCAPFREAATPPKGSPYPIFRSLLRKYRETVDIHTEMRVFFKRHSARRMTRPSPADFRNWLDRKYPNKG